MPLARGLGDREVDDAEQLREAHDLIAVMGAMGVEAAIADARGDPFRI